MNVSFYLKGSSVRVSDGQMPNGAACTHVWVEESGGPMVSFLVDASDAADLLAIADAMRAAALTHLPAPEPVAMEA